MKKISKLLAILLTAGFLSPATARDNFPNAKAPKSQLLIESEQLKILTEAGVQKEESRSRRTFGIKFAPANANRLSVFANERTVSYQTGRHPGLAGQLGYYPVEYHGRWGLIAGYQYAYLEGSGPVLTALHWSEASLLLGYRYEKPDSYFRPFAGVGGATEVLVQRGPSFYNTSEAQGVTLATMGSNFNLSKLLNLRSPLTWELSLAYRRVWAPKEQNLDFNGDSYAVGLDLAL